MMFIRSFVFFLGVLAALALGWAGIVGVPGIMLSTVEPTPDLKRYTALQFYGRSIYMREGCLYCHSQQVRPQGFGADQKRFWGRASVPADYVYDQPHLLGTMRTGPDLLNVAARLPAADWHLLHLYNPRLVTPGSLMPPFPWLFLEKETPGPEERSLALPDSLTPPGRVVVPGEEATALVAYLLCLDRTFPVTQRVRDRDSLHGGR